MAFQIKRIYEEASLKDGHRVLVDRLWPRGVRKDDARLDEWAKDISPSTQLRRWFGHDASRFGEFTQRYTNELDANPEVARMAELGQAHDTVTLLYGASDPLVNHAAVLRHYLSST
jgi:uncharacterized protein YeaO (DUF488 family)